ncbi:MAG: MATE family efflux transporter [Bacteroidota bacterium]
MKDQQKQFILTGSLPKVMWQLAWPAVAAMVLFGLNSFMDTVYVGQLMNETALAGVALAYPLTSIMLGLGSWAGTGAANLLSIAIGDNDQERQRQLLPNATLFAIVSTLIFGVPAYIFAEPLIRMMGGSGEILTQGVLYFRATLLAGPLWVYGLTLNMVIRGEGKMKTAAGMMALGLLPNLVLTPVFIAVFDMGVAGAAWATNLGMLIYSLLGYRYFARKRASFSAEIASLRHHKPTFQAILKSGFPGFILTVMGLVQAIVVLNAIVQVGSDSDVAFFAAANRILLFLMTPLFGLMRALQPVIGINFGAQQYDRVRQSFNLFTKTGIFLVGPFWLLLTLFPEASLRLVLPEYVMGGQELLYLRVYLAVLPLLPVVFMALTFFPAIDQPKHASLVGMARQLVFYVPVMLLLPRYFGLGWVYYGATLIDVVITLWIGILVLKEMKTLRSPVPAVLQNG